MVGGIVTLLETVGKEESEFHEKLKKIILYFLDLYQQKPD